MNGIKRSIGFAIFATVILVASSTAASAQGILSDILKRMDDNNKGMKSLKSNIKMSKHNSQLDEYDISEGTVQYLPAATKEQIRVRIDDKLSRIRNTTVSGDEDTVLDLIGYLLILRMDFWFHC